MKQKILLVGSVAFDIIFSVHGNIKDEILIKDGEIGDVSMMFTANGKQKYFGGTAGNIAFGLSELGESSSLFTVVGKDFKDDYQEYLKSKSVDLRDIVRKDLYTATFYAISDTSYQQIGIWQPDAYGEYVDQSSLLETISKDELANFEYAIFAPGTGVSTLKHIIEFRKYASENAKVIFDPSQVLTIFYDENRLKDCLTHSDILIGNETEIKQFETVFNISKQEIFDLGITTIIETLGKNGVTLHKSDRSVTLDSIKPRKVVETTGAGDSFRAGFLFGQVNGYSEEDSCKIGTFIGAKCVEELSGQMYRIDQEEFNGYLKSL